MATFRGPRNRPNLGPPPTEAEVPGNLEQPETAPVDGRSRRATGRTRQLATRVREEFHQELKIYAARHKLKLVEVLELGHQALLEKEKNSS